MHPFHLVDFSPWPLLSGFSTFSLTLSAVIFFHSYVFGGFYLFCSFIFVLFSMVIWWRDVIREATFEGFHTNVVQSGLKNGIFLFIVSEVIFFLAFFWAFFHSSLSPAIEIGSIWPPKYINTLDTWEIPFLNTLLLLLSGVFVTWSHHSLLSGNRFQGLFSLVVTIFLAFLFTFFQGLEYVDSFFGLSDSVYGSVFFTATGFHGLHVLIGTVFLICCLVRIYKYHFTKSHHFGYEAALVYYHFVDVVWLFLFVTFYYWSSLSF